VVSALLVAWFAVLERDNVLGDRASSRVIHEPKMSAADWRRTIDELRAAELLDPAKDWRVSRANVLLLRDKREALRVAREIVRREPDNLSAWTVMWQATRASDPPLAKRAVAEIKRLNPSP
jgi:hypothetical protein